MTTRTGGRILVDQLRIQGCDRIFTVPGESFLAVLDALHDTPEIDVTVCRQESGAAMPPAWVKADTFTSHFPAFTATSLWTKTSTRLLPAGIFPSAAAGR